MIHQRPVKWAMRIIAFIIVLLAVPYLPFIGRYFNLLVASIVFAVVWIPIEFLIEKVFPAPDWYAHEDESAKVTSLNLTQTKILDNDKRNS